jgi:Ulp1 family protease
MDAFSMPHRIFQLPKSFVKETKERAEVIERARSKSVRVMPGVIQKYSPESSVVRGAGSRKQEEQDGNERESFNCRR